MKVKGHSRSTVIKRENIKNTIFGDDKLGLISNIAHKLINNRNEDKTLIIIVSIHFRSAEINLSP